MLSINYNGLQYRRILTQHVTPEILEACKQEADYSFVVCYENVLEDTDFEVLDKNACLFDLSLSDARTILLALGVLRHCYSTRMLDFQGATFHYT